MPLSNSGGLTAAHRALILSAALFLGACASTSAPVVYSAQRDSVVLDERVRADIAHCGRAADARVGRNGLSPQEAAKKSASTAGIGLVATAVGGAVARSQDVWQRARGAAAGGAAGMATKLLLDWNEGDEVYQKYVERCLKSRGHEVLGWR
jgi:outer membrane lipoprotein SlyB